MYYLNIYFIKELNAIQINPIGVLSSYEVRDLLNHGWDYDQLNNSWSKEYNAISRAELGYIFKDLTR